MLSKRHCRSGTQLIPTAHFLKSPLVLLYSLFFVASPHQYVLYLCRHYIQFPQVKTPPARHYRLNERKKFTLSPRNIILLLLRTIPIGFCSLKRRPLRLLIPQIPSRGEVFFPLILMVALCVSTHLAKFSLRVPVREHSK